MPHFCNPSAAFQLNSNSCVSKHGMTCTERLGSRQRPACVLHLVLQACSLESFHSEGKRYVSQSIVCSLCLPGFWPPQCRGLQSFLPACVQVRRLWDHLTHAGLTAAMLPSGSCVGRSGMVRDLETYACAIVGRVQGSPGVPLDILLSCVCCRLARTRAW